MSEEKRCFRSGMNVSDALDAIETALHQVEEGELRPEMLGNTIMPTVDRLELALRKCRPVEKFTSIVEDLKEAIAHKDVDEARHQLGSSTKK